MFVSERTGSDEEPWKLVEVAHNLLHIRYPDFSKDQIQRLERSSIIDLVSALSSVLEYLAEEANCKAIVIDCHGGPDNLSFAACHASDYSLLVSEPDRITFYGTLHFVRQIEQSALELAESNPTAKPDIRLVFNKVVPAFSLRYLTRFYNLNLRQMFGNHPLLALFPMELYLTKEFEKTPFLTDVYPFSMLERKTEVMVLDLLKNSGPAVADLFLPNTPWPSRVRARKSMGKDPWIINVNLIMAVIAIVFVTAYLLGFVFGGWLTATSTLLRTQIRNAEVMIAFQRDPTLVPKACSSLNLSAKPRCFVETYYSEMVKAYQLGCSNQPTPQGCESLDSLPIFRRLTHECFDNDGTWLDRTDAPAKAQIESLRKASGPTGEVAEALKVVKEPRWFRLIEGVQNLFQRKQEFLGGGVALWLLSAVGLQWSRGLDRLFTYQLRRRPTMLASMPYVSAVCLWALPLLAAGSLSTNYDVAPVLFFLAIPWALAIMTELWKFYINIRFERRNAEGLLRVIFVAYLIAFPLVGRWFLPDMPGLS